VVKGCVDEGSGKFRGNRQQDAHEFVMEVLERLEGVDVERVTPEGVGTTPLGKGLGKDEAMEGATTTPGVKPAEEAEEGEGTAVTPKVAGEGGKGGEKGVFDMTVRKGD